MKKRTISFLTLLLIIVALSGCAVQPKPEETVISFLDTFKTGNTTDIPQYFDRTISAFDSIGKLIVIDHISDLVDL